MYLLANDEMYEIIGGAAKKLGVWTVVGGIVSFVVGIFNGFFQTKSCKLR